MLRDKMEAYSKRNVSEAHVTGQKGSPHQVGCPGPSCYGTKRKPPPSRMSRSLLLRDKKEAPTKRNVSETQVTGQKGSVHQAGCPGTPCYGTKRKRPSSRMSRTLLLRDKKEAPTKWDVPEPHAPKVVFSFVHIQFINDLYNPICKRTKRKYNIKI